jgi:transposase
MACRPTRVASCKTTCTPSNRWLRVERLPGYAPELNPTESLWQNIKGQERANFCGTSLRCAAAQCRRGVRRVRRRPSLRFSFLEQAGLSL